MSGVTYLRDHTASVDLSTEQVLERATSADLSGAMVIGITKDGDLYFETSISDGEPTIWLMERVRHLIVSASFRT